MPERDRPRSLIDVAPRPGRRQSASRGVWVGLIVLWILQAVEVRAVRAQATSADALVIPRLEGRVELDGRIDEAAWRNARMLRLVQHQPAFGEEPTERTEVLIGYTEEALYLACRCYDRETPSAPSFKRDFYSEDTDYFSLVLDTFDDNENAVAFETTPTGVRADQVILNDATGESPNDNDWNTFWDVAVVQTDEGWFSEMRVPISSLRFQARGSEVVMGLIVTRYIARKNEIAGFPAIPPNWGGWSPWKPSQARDVVFESLEPRTPLRVTPYLLGGVGRQNELDDSGNAYRTQTEPAYDAGIDVKYGLTSNLTLDVTVNTDFAQVEADNQQVNLTRFPLFFPEKRRFFLERSSNFAFDFGEENRLFYSRRIGLHEGREVRILGGARLVGRAGPWDVGLLTMQTAGATGPGVEMPSENFGVGRLRRRVLNPYSYVGGIVTSRARADGDYHVAYGLDGIFRVAGDEYVSVKWAQTFDQLAPQARSVLDPARVMVRWERRSYEGLSYDVAYGRAGPRYDPALGFELRHDYYQLGERIGYGWLPGGTSFVQRHRIDLEGAAFYRNTDGSLESLEFGPAWSLYTNGGHRLAFGVQHRIEDLQAPFPLSDAVSVPAGRHVFQVGELSYGMPSGGTFRTDAGLTAGRFFDGWRGSVLVSPTWNASRYLRMTGDYQHDRVYFPGRDERFTAHVGRIRLEVTPNVRYSIQAFIQYNSAVDGVAANVRFRYNPREGNDFYLVFNEQLDTDRPLAYPRRPLSTGRTVLLKYTYTFGW